MLSIKQPPLSQAAKEKVTKNRATRGGSKGDSDKVPSTSKFHFSKGKYGNVVLAWHGALTQKAKANFTDICAQARKIFGVAGGGIGNDDQQAQNTNTEVRTHVALDSESESEGENKGDNEDHGNNNTEDNRNSDVHYRSNDGSNNDTDDHGNSYNGGQNELEAGPSRLDYYNHAVDVLEIDDEEIDVEEETEVDLGPSCLGGRRGSKALSRK
jgi:hypothetical protein